MEVYNKSKVIPVCFQEDATGIKPCVELRHNKLIGFEVCEGNSISSETILKIHKSVFEEGKNLQEELQNHKLVLNQNALECFITTLDGKFSYPIGMHYFLYFYRILKNKLINL